MLGWNRSTARFTFARKHGRLIPANAAATMTASGNGIEVTSGKPPRIEAIRRRQFEVDPDRATAGAAFSCGYAARKD